MVVNCCSRMLHVLSKFICFVNYEIRNSLFYTRDWNEINFAILFSIFFPPLLFHHRPMISVLSSNKNKKKNKILNKYTSSNIYIYIRNIHRVSKREINWKQNDRKNKFYFSRSLCQARENNFRNNHFWHFNHIFILKLMFQLKQSD